MFITVGTLRKFIAEEVDRLVRSTAGMTGGAGVGSAGPRGAIGEESTLGDAGDEEKLEVNVERKRTQRRA